MYGIFGAVYKSHRYSLGRDGSYSTISSCNVGCLRSVSTLKQCEAIKLGTIDGKGAFIPTMDAVLD